MGPDLHRIGGKYPDAWHRRHMDNPVSMVPGSNMPGYAFLNSERVDPELTRSKMKTLGFPYQEADITGLAGKTEMDAIVSYMQKLGADVARPKAAGAAGPNPYANNQQAVQEGRELFAKHCSSCHGKDNVGDLAGEIRAEGYDDAKVYGIIFNGEPKEGMPAFPQLGNERVWKLVAFLKGSRK